MGTVRMLIGFIFLMSPDYSIIDILPDFIGYLLIISGISKISQIDERADDARMYAKRLALLSLIKFIVSVFYFNLTQSWLLLSTFCIALLDIILVIQFCDKFFYSAEYVSTRQGFVLNTEKINAMKILTVIFLITKDVLMVAPTVLSLFDPQFTGNFSGNWYMNFDAMGKILTLLAFAVEVVFAIVYGCSFIPAYKRIINNKELFAKLYENYDRKIRDNPGYSINREAVTFCTNIPLVLFVMCDFYVDFYEVLPTAVGFIIMFYITLHMKSIPELNIKPLRNVSLVGFFITALTACYRAYYCYTHRALGDGIFNTCPDRIVIGAVYSLSVGIFVYTLLRTVSLLYSIISEEAKVLRVMPALAGMLFAASSFFTFALPELNVYSIVPICIFYVLFCIYSFGYLKDITIYSKTHFNQ